MRWSFEFLETTDYLKHWLKRDCFYHVILDTYNTSTVYYVSSPSLLCHTTISHSESSRRTISLLVGTGRLVRGVQGQGGDDLLETFY